MNWLKTGVGMLAGLAATQTALFEDRTVASGIAFVTENGATSEKFMIETMGSGVGVIDYDHDGRMDIVFVNGGGRPGTKAASTDRLALYRNAGSFRFTDVTRAAGLQGSFNTYGMGVAVGDYDNDGYPDLLLTGYPRSVLFHNNGDGTFTDVTSKAGVGNENRWATSAGWFDYDRDGLLDLAIANYVADFSWNDSKFCGDRAPGRRTYCHPDVYHGAGVTLYHNDGSGRFRDVTRQSGLETSGGKCLGLVLADLNGDGWPDIFVANDSVQNFLYVNRGNGAFTETALSSGVGFSDDGQPEAGMGVDVADVNGDLRPDIYVTHLDNELNRLYLNAGDGQFHDATTEWGLGADRSLLSGFGVKFADFRNLGRPDLLVANGHILDNVALFHPRVEYREPMVMLMNSGADKLKASSPIPAKLLGRGLAVSDFDQDGRLDFVVSQNNGPPLLARNRETDRHWITLNLDGTGKSNRDAVGAVVILKAGGKSQYAQVTGASSYCSANDRAVHFGLGSANRIDAMEIRWPSGRNESLPPPSVNRIVNIREGSLTRQTR